MQRRTLLTAISSWIAACAAALVTVPGASYIWGTVRRRRLSRTTVQRVARLADLTPGQPFEAPVVAPRVDAWTLYPDEAVGRVWLVRQGDAQTPPAQTKVDALSNICPHLGCAVQLTADRRGFDCPCHKAVFKLSGEPRSSAELGYRNPTPRGLDALECRVVEDAQTREWWVEVKYQVFEQGLTKKVAKA